MLLGGCGANLPGHYTKLDYRAPAGVDVTAGDAAGGSTTAFYVTNREPTGTTAAQAYSERRSAVIHYGRSDVKVPRVHNLGRDVVTEQLSRALNRPQPGHFEVRSSSEFAAAGGGPDVDAFFGALAAALGETPDKDVIVLVHGYNSSFAGPVARAAELAYGLGTRAVPVAYCWTSRAATERYTHDENDVDFAARQLATFLAQMTARLGSVAPAARVHVVGHSMGTRVLTQALARVKASLPPPAAGQAPPFKNLVFAAADVDAAEFAARMVDDGLARLAARTTLYAAYNDRALVASEYVHGREYPRAGRAGAGLLVLPGVDTVDVSLNDASVVGHSYYGDNRAVVYDLHMLLVLDLPPAKRNLYRAEKGGLPYWLIRP
jgi:esterase/lipase superfamily enzyme